MYCGQKRQNATDMLEPVVPTSKLLGMVIGAISPIVVRVESMTESFLYSPSGSVRRPLSINQACSPM